jgi:hypothetical protein
MGRSLAMVLYYSRRFEAASIGARLVTVSCDKCGTEYFYKLARVGSGSASAPYAIGSAGASQESKKQAREDLDRRLADEAELVPCPKCHWINEDLVSGYRRGRYRGWGRFAAGLGIFGIAVSLVAAWFLSNGPAADRSALPYVLVGGPAASVSLSALLLLLRSWLSRRIRPNANHPFPPKLPGGCPPPLIKDPATGELVAAPPPPGQDTPADDWVDFQVGRDALPVACSGCLSLPSPPSAYRRPLFPAVELVVPRCAPCERRRKRTMWKVALIIFGATMAVMLAVLFALKPDEIVFWLCVAGLGSVVALVGISIGDRLTSPVRVEFVDKSRGIIRLRFRNDDYRKLFESNVGGPA